MVIYRANNKYNELLTLNKFKFSSGDLESEIYLYRVLSDHKEIGKGKMIIE